MALARLGGMACLMAPLLAPAPALGPAVPVATARIAPPDAAFPIRLGDSGLMTGTSGLMTQALRLVPDSSVTQSRPTRLVAVSEPGTAALFLCGVAALLYARRRRRGASGLDGTGAGR